MHGICMDRHFKPRHFSGLGVKDSKAIQILHLSRMSFFVGQMSDVKFNAMVAGECGAGKSTFIETFSTPFIAVTGDRSPSCSIFFHEAPEYDEYESIDDNALALQNIIVSKHREWINSSTMLVTESVSAVTQR